MGDGGRTPADLRNMFGANLRRLAEAYPSVSELCRQLGINRTQFNRYLAGESFPRPDVLDRICGFFQVDARILLQPLDDIPSKPADLPHFLAQFLGQAQLSGGSDILPAGFHHLVEFRPDAPDEQTDLLIHVRRIPPCTMVLRAFDRSTAGTAPPAAREVRGIACASDASIHVLMSHRNAVGGKVLVLSGECPTSGAARPGYSVDLLTDAPRFQRIQLRFLGSDLGAALKIARQIRA